MGVIFRRVDFCFLVATVFAISGCGGLAVSPTDQTLIKEADQLHARLEPAVVENRDARLRRYFEQIAGRILTAAKELDQKGLIKSDGEGSNAWMFSNEVDFHLVDSKELSGFTSGGRHVYIYDGLFQLCKSEDELASVFCHEYAHIYARHVQQDLRRDPALSGEEALLFPFVAMRASPGQDRAADAIAFAIYARAGWDPGRFATVYQRMLDMNVAGVDRGRLKEKVIEAQRRADALPPAARDWGQPPVADEARFAQLQSEAKSLVATGARNPRAELLLAAFPNNLSSGESAAQAEARQRLFPPAPAASDNQWNKGLPGR
jgi:predicted Zn-dependent protease